MKVITEEFTETITWNQFDVGERVVAVSPGYEPREELGVYVVTECRGPLYAGGEAVVFFEGVPHGHNPNHFKPAN